MNINRLRGDRVIVRFEENTNPYEETSSGLLVASKTKESNSELKRGTIVKVGHDINPRDLKEGMVVYTKLFQGERLFADSKDYLFNEKHIIGNE